MTLPAFNANGDLPPGVYPATLADVKARFGLGTVQRHNVTARPIRIHRTAVATGNLMHFVIFGSYITNKAEPNDVDVILVMSDDFMEETCDEVTRKLFDHEQANDEYGASVFWVKPTVLFLDTLEDFIAHWQVKRDQTLRGIVEVTA
jgi:hypothetical protein